MRQYDIDTSWDDPFDHQVERRIAPRFKFKLRLSIVADDVDNHTRAVGPGIVRNLSLTGACLVTKHVLRPFQRIRVELPTAVCSDELCLPASFEGSAQVVRADSLDGEKSQVALRFGDDLVQNMEFAVFVDHLQTMARLMISSPRVA